MLSRSRKLTASFTDDASTDAFWHGHKLRSWSASRAGSEAKASTALVSSIGSDRPSGMIVGSWSAASKLLAALRTFGHLSGPEGTYRLDPGTRTYRYMGRPFARALFNGEGRVAIPLGKVCFRYAPPVAGASGTERLETVSAEVSHDLGLVVASHRSDPIGSIDYRLTNIRRDEPPAEMFDVPADYAFVQGSAENPLLQLNAWNNNLCGLGTPLAATPEP